MTCSTLSAGRGPASTAAPWRGASQRASIRVPLAVQRRTDRSARSSVHGIALLLLRRAGIDRRSSAVVHAVGRLSVDGLLAARGVARRWVGGSWWTHGESHRRLAWVLPTGILPLVGVHLAHHDASGVSLLIGLQGGARARRGSKLGEGRIVRRFCLSRTAGLKGGEPRRRQRKVAGERSADREPGRGHLCASEKSGGRSGSEGPRRVRAPFAASVASSSRRTGIAR